MLKSAKEESEKIDIINHKYLENVNKKIYYKDGSIYFNDIKIPEEIISASFANFGDQSKFSAYINGWITNLNTKKYDDISNMYPFFDDGTVFSDTNTSFDDLVKTYWPNITSGVKKKFQNLFRVRIDYAMFIVSVFKLNPNDEITALEIISKGKKQPIQHTDLGLVNMLKNSDVMKILNVKNIHNFSKLIRGDDDWYRHLMSISATISDILDYDPDRKIQMFYPLNNMSAYCNKIKSSIGRYRVYFNKYIYMYEFFDGIDIGDGLIIRMPKSNSDLANWGYFLHNCVGGDKYVNMCYECKSQELIYMIEKKGEPYILAYVDEESPIQIFLDNNKNLADTNAELHDKIFQIGKAILLYNIPYLRQYITQEHIIMKSEQYKEKGWKSAVKIQPQTSLDI